MENDKSEDEQKVKDKKNRLDVIDEILERFDVLSIKRNEKNILNMEKKNEIEIEQIRDYFTDLNADEIAYILFLVSQSDERKVE